MITKINWNDNPLKAIAELMQRLISLLNQETALIKKSKVSETDALREEKLEIITILEIARKELSANPAIASKSKPEHKKLLEQVSVELTSAMKENYQELVRAREVNKKIM